MTVAQLVKKYSKRTVKAGGGGGMAAIFSDLHKNIKIRNTMNFKTK
jgi:hypothetical protein